jgi:DNA-binding NarL/FixJ family response regulator
MTEPAHSAHIRVLVAARYPSIRAGLRAMLDGPATTVVGELGAFSFDAEIEPGAADVLVADIEDADEFESIAALGPDLPLVLLATDPAFYRELSDRALSPGALLLKGATGDEVVAAVVAVAQGLVVFDPAVARVLQHGGVPAIDAGAVVSPLTSREQDVLRLVATGIPNKAIALQLGISEHTVKFHVGAILGKLGAASRTEAVTVAVRAGLLPL